MAGQAIEYRTNGLITWVGLNAAAIKNLLNSLLLWFNIVKITLWWCVSAGWGCQLLHNFPQSRSQFEEPSSLIRPLSIRCPGKLAIACSFQPKSLRT